MDLFCDNSFVYCFRLLAKRKASKGKQCLLSMHLSKISRWKSVKSFWLNENGEILRHHSSFDFMIFSFAVRTMFDRWVHIYYRILQTKFSETEQISWHLFFVLHTDSSDKAAKTAEAHVAHSKCVVSSNNFNKVKINEFWDIFFWLHAWCSLPLIDHNPFYRS